MKKILVINFGSTSSKLSIFADNKEIRKISVSHTHEELAPFKCINEQLPLREKVVRDSLAEANEDISSFDAIIARAGGTAPISGTYKVNELMIDRLLNRSHVAHVANLCSVVAFKIAAADNIPVFTHSFSRDEMLPITKISGFPGLERKAEGHMENWWAISEMTAKKYNTPYNEMNMIICHMGGGTTMSLHQHGRIVDVIGDTEGAFGPERCGGLPIAYYTDIVLSGKYSNDELHKLIRGKGGMFAYLGTTDGRVVEEKIRLGDKNAEEIYHAMALQEAKAIALLAAVGKGKIDVISLSGGLAYSKIFVEWIKEYISFIAPVEVFPGEYEAQAMAMCGIQALENPDIVNEYTIEIDNKHP